MRTELQRLANYNIDSTGVGHVRTDVRTDIQNWKENFFTSIMTKQFFGNCLGQGESIDTFKVDIH